MTSGRGEEGRRGAPGEAGILGLPGQQRTQSGQQVENVSTCKPGEQPAQQGEQEGEGGKLVPQVTLQ